MRKRKTILALLLFIAGAANLSFKTEDPQDREYNLKAAFVYRFLEYIEWETLPSASGIQITIVGESAISQPLEALSKAVKPGARPMNIKTIDEKADLPLSQVLFISRNVKAGIEAIVRRTEQRPMLIITETKGALDQGSHINFLVVENKLRFEVNLRNTARAGLRISSQLLQHASSIKR